MSPELGKHVETPANRLAPKGEFLGIAGQWVLVTTKQTNVPSNETLNSHKSFIQKPRFSVRVGATKTKTDLLFVFILRKSRIAEALSTSLINLFISGSLEETPSFI